MEDGGLVPIFLIGSSRTARLLENAMWPYEPENEKLNYELTREEGYLDGYICHLQGIECYQLPFGVADSCILIARESFRLMRIRRLGDGRYVDVEFHEDAENTAKGSLLLTFWLEGQLGKEAAYKYIIPADTD